VSSIARFRCLFGAANLLLPHHPAFMTPLSPVLYHREVNLVRPCQPVVILRRCGPRLWLCLSWISVAPGLGWFGTRFSIPRHDTQIVRPIAQSVIPLNSYHSA